VLASPATTRQLQDFVRSRLSEPKTPHRVVVVDQLPRNASGKVLKRELPGLLEADAGELSGPSDDDSPLTPVETAVLAIWQEALGREGFGAHDDFFELGGHSLAAAQIAARLQEAFSPELSLTVVFEHPTVAELADVVEAIRS
jgi:acyl carrier protein